MQIGPQGGPGGQNIQIIASLSYHTRKLWFILAVLLEDFLFDLEHGQKMALFSH